MYLELEYNSWRLVGSGPEKLALSETCVASSPVERRRGGGRGEVGESIFHEGAAGKNPYETIKGMTT